MRSSLLSLFFLISSSTFGADKSVVCKDGGRIMKIGCTVECEEPYRKALSDAAGDLGYKIEIVTMKTPEDLDTVDAYLSPGGHDIDPKYYTKNVTADERAKILDLHQRLGNGGKTEPRHLERDEREFKFMNRYLEKSEYANLPFLGVCYGMQMMAAAQGIPLTVDMKEQLGIGERRKVHDEIDLREESLLRSYIKGDKIKGYKNHHQSVSVEYWNQNKSKHPNVLLTGTSHAGRVAEVLELKDRPALGIQFHAERTENDAPARLAPYKWFLERACARKTATKKATS